MRLGCWVVCGYEGLEWVGAWMSCVMLCYALLCSVEEEEEDGK